MAETTPKPTLEALAMENPTALPYLQFLTAPIFEVIIAVPEDDHTEATVRHTIGTLTLDDDDFSDSEIEIPPNQTTDSSSNKSLFGSSGTFTKSGKAGRNDALHTPSTTGGTSAFRTVTFSVHKALLESLSREMKKHIRNSMREGLSNKMHLSDVLPDTFARFVQWAYTGEYPYSDVSTLGRSDKTPSILVHARLFVLAERFNIVTLRALAGSRIAALLDSLTTLPNWDDVETINNLSQGFSTLLSNLPNSFLERPYTDKEPEKTPEMAGNESSLVKEETEVEKVLSKVLSFCASQANKLRMDMSYRELMVANTAFVLAVADVLSVKHTIEGMRKEEWRCGRCFNLLTTAPTSPRDRVKCTPCGVPVGPSLAV